MKEKAPKSPLLVVLTMIFLLMFIVIPPLLRTYMPKEEEKISNNEINVYKLYCEGVSIAENKKVTSTISYENDVALMNTMTFMEYISAADEKGVDISEITIEQEITNLKSVSGVDFFETENNTFIITLVQQNVDEDLSNIELQNYLGNIDATTSYFEGRGFICSKVDD